MERHLKAAVTRLLVLHGPLDRNLHCPDAHIHTHIHIHVNRALGWLVPVFYLYTYPSVLFI